MQPPDRQDHTHGHGHIRYRIIIMDTLPQIRYSIIMTDKAT
jgi:hypothetical protein